MHRIHAKSSLKFQKNLENLFWKDLEGRSDLDVHFDSVRTVRSTRTRLAPRAALAIFDLAAEWWCQKSKRASHVKRSGNNSERDVVSVWFPRFISRKWFKLTILFAICNSLGRIKMPSYYFSLSTSAISGRQETTRKYQQKSLYYRKPPPLPRLKKRKKAV